MMKALIVYDDVDAGTLIAQNCWKCTSSMELQIFAVAFATVFISNRNLIFLLAKAWCVTTWSSALKKALALPFPFVQNS